MRARDTKGEQLLEGLRLREETRVVLLENLIVRLPLTNAECPDLREPLVMSARLRCERASELGEEQKPRQVMAVVLALAASLLSFHRTKVTL